MLEKEIEKNKGKKGCCFKKKPLSAVYGFSLACGLPQFCPFGYRWVSHKKTDTSQKFSNNTLPIERQRVK